MAHGNDPQYLIDHDDNSRLPVLNKTFQGRMRRAFRKLPAPKRSEPLVAVLVVDLQPEEKPKSAIEQFDDRYQRWIQTNIDPLLGRDRQQLADMLKSNVKDTVSPTNEKLANRRLGYASLTVGFGLVGSVVPVANLLALPFLGMVVYSWAGLAWRDVRTGRGLKLPSLVVSSWVLALLAGQVTGAGFLILVSQLSAKLRYIVEDHSSGQFIESFAQLPREVWVITDDAEHKIPLDDLQAGDILIASAGETIAADGVVIEGNGLVDQHMFSGESQLSEKTIGSEVYASTTVMSGKLHIEVHSSGSDTISTQIIDVLNATRTYQMSVQSKGIKLINDLAPYQVSAAWASLFLVNPIFATAIAWVPFATPAIVASPIAMLNFVNLAAARQILIKDARSLELLSDVDTVVFDKTGTLTRHLPEVGEIFCFSDYSERDLLSLAATAEQYQSHPIALAILKLAEEREVETITFDESSYEVGFGIQVEIEGQQVRVGSLRLMQNYDIAIPDEVQNLTEKVALAGSSLVFISINDELAGALEIVPVYRFETQKIIAYLKERNIEIVVISGDHEAPTRRLANHFGIKRYHANTLPEQKAAIVEDLQAEGRNVVFVGDGINDGIALKTAQVGMSIQGSTDIALNAAQIVFMDGSLNQLPYLFELADQFEQNTKQLMQASIYPGLFFLGGTVFLGWGIPTLAFANVLVSFTGIGIAMLPFAQERLKPTDEANSAEVVNIN